MSTPDRNSAGMPWPLIAGTYVATIVVQLLLCIATIMILGGEAHAGMQLPSPRHELVWMLYFPAAWFGINCACWLVCRLFRIRASVATLIVAIQPMPAAAMLLALVGFINGEAAIAASGIITAALYAVSIIAALRWRFGAVRD